MPFEISPKKVKSFSVYETKSKSYGRERKQQQRKIQKKKLYKKEQCFCFVSSLNFPMDRNFRVKL